MVEMIEGRLAYVPVLRNGQVVVDRLSPASGAEAWARAETEAERIAGIETRRIYFAGEQYAEQNDRRLQEYRAAGAGNDARLPEHHRLHAYSTQIEDCLEFIANNVANGFQITAKQRAVQEVVDAAVAGSPQLVTYDESGQLVPSFTAGLQDALVAGDVAAHVLWDEVEAKPYIELWESEKVEFVMADTTRVEMVVRREQVWRAVEGTDVPIQDTEIEVYRLAHRLLDDGTLVREAKREVFWSDDDEPHAEEWLGVGRIPWVPIRVGRDGLRSYRGQSVISKQAMETADRYNAVEQQGFLISRYNSHANIAVVGDAAALQVQSEGHVQKDVADVLTFPGGTHLQVLELPTDPQMIEHQRSVLSEALHSQFGVTRLEPDALQGMGDVTGYALEILNRKSRGTLSRIVSQTRQDWVALIHLLLDVAAWKTGGPDGEPDAAEDQFVVAEDVATDDAADGYRWWEVNPAEVFPDRRVAIVMGTIDVVDESRVRADFTAGMISREEALRQRGYSEPQIRQIVREKDAAAATVQAAMFGGEGRSVETTRPGQAEDVDQG